MMTRLRRKVLATALLSLTTGAFAADFDGSKALICATIAAHACDPGETCIRGLPASVGVPDFMRIDFARQTIAGPRRTTQIRSIDKSGDQLLLQGTELGYAWSIAIDKSDGSMSLTLVNHDDAFVVFGNCTPP